MGTVDSETSLAALRRCGRLVAVAELVYIDESGSVGKGANRQRYLILVAIVVDETMVQRMATRMNELAMAHLG